MAKPTTKSADNSTFDLLREFADKTSMHGAGRVVGKGGLPRKLAWLLIVLTGFGKFMEHIEMYAVSYVNIFNIFILKKENSKE